MHVGVDYYPEHWPEDRWPHDLDMMVEHGFNIIRIAEFAWSRFEPRRDAFDFSWTDTIIDLCTDRGIAVMMGVPVRNVPPWLMAEDPGMAIEAYDGHREGFGSRYTTCLTNELLRSKSLGLTHELGSRYAQNETVVAWHLDNEYGDGSICYCDRCRARFIEWLQSRYDSIESLNGTWGLTFWSLELSSWDEIWLPRKTNRFPHNPSLLQEYRRFTSDVTATFVSEQCEVLRSCVPGATITTNLQSMTRYHTDYYSMCRDVDIVSVNYYPPNSYTSADLDVVRGIKHRPFWVVEQRSGAQGFTHRAYPTPEPGETRMYTFQSIGHGADSVLFFRWRPTPYGQEQFHGGVLRQDGSRTRISDEISAMQGELKQLAEAIHGTTVRNEVGALMSYDARWALEYYHVHPAADYRELFLQYYRALERQQVPMDVVHPESDLSNYRLIVVPMVYLMEQAALENLVTFVRNGGVAVVSTGTAVKDHFANLHPSGMPQELAEMLGIAWHELVIIPEDRSQYVSFPTHGTYAARCWADRVSATNARVLGSFTDYWYRHSPAVTQNRFAGGQAYFVGTLTEDSFYDALLARIVSETGVRRLLNGHPGIEVVSRVNQEHEFLFVMNRTNKDEAVACPADARVIVGASSTGGVLRLEPYGVSVIRRNRDHGV